MDYLTLTNKVIQEAGLDLDDLTSGDFASPTVKSKMYTRVKNWVSQAWRDIQLENNEWEFGKGTGIVSILPRVLVKLGDRATAPPSGSEYISASGGVSFVVDTPTLISGTWAGGTAEAWLDLESIDGNSLIWLESYDELDPTPASDVFALKYHGRYNPRSLAADLEEIDYETIKIQNPETGYDQNLKFIPWSQWKDQYEGAGDARGTPQLVTETPEGYMDFWPRPDREYTLSFEYTKSPNDLVAHDDVPEGLDSRYHEAIQWLAVMYAANYDEKPKLWDAAKKRYTKYIFAIDRDIGPKPSFGGCEFDE